MIMEYVLASRNFSDEDAGGEGFHANNALSRTELIYFFALAELELGYQLFIVGNYLSVMSHCVLLLTLVLARKCKYLAGLFYSYVVP